MLKNRLVKEKSPYLLQHANNPVDWYPWCEEAFEKAKKEDKPIFLSIGYSTCHWCHVMEHESFEDEKVAELMNDAFVSIKVDREERPDIDGIYMTVSQMLTGSGGWPLTIIMTPDKKPFFAGTYFPKGNRFGRSGMLEIIPRIKELWNSKREDILKSAEEISAAVARTNKTLQGETPDEEILKKAFSRLSQRFDSEKGGFGSAPKFPTPHNFLFLLRYWKREGETSALEMVKKTLTEMRMGGIYDHIGFGFHRYSTDRDWLVPHFEKMLYDQAMLAIAYTETYQATKEKIFKETAEEILEYVLRDMTSTEGGFYSAEDADSEGEEGKFYVWDEKEIRGILKDDAEIFIKIFNIENDGNFVDQTLGGAAGTNILHLTKPVGELSKQLNLPEKEIRDKINSARKRIFKAREKRVPPYKDDKILTDWNGLMISALSKSAQVFGKKEYADVAEKAADFLLTKMRDTYGKLFHRYRQGEAAIDGNIDDYAFFIAGLIDLYETTFNIKYLISAIELNDILIKYFCDEETGGFYFTDSESEKLLTRQKEIYDGAIPSGNSVAFMNLLRLGKITGRLVYEEEAEKLVKSFFNIVNNAPVGFSYFLCGLDFALGPSKEIVVAGKPAKPETKKMLNYIYNNYLPNKILILKDAEESEISDIATFTKEQTEIDGKTTLYVCENYNCKLPVTDPEKLNDLLV